MKSKLKWSLPAAILLIAMAGTSIWWKYFADNWQAPRVVTIEGSKALWSFFPSYPFWGSDAEEGAVQALLLRDGDYIVENNAVRYLASDGLALKMSSNDWSMSLGGKIVTVNLGEEDGLKWLSGASKQQLADLRMVVCPEDVDAPMLLALRQLAAVNENVDLELKSEMALRQVLPLFRPRAVFLDEGQMDPPELLANQPQLETLMINASKPGSLDHLPKLPGLRRLFLVDWNPADAGPLPAGLDGLKSLGFFTDGGNLDLAALSSVPAGLDTLVVAADGIVGMSQLEKMPGLRTLLLGGGDEKVPLDLSSIANLKALRWLGLPAQVSQEQFADIVKRHPKLAILEMPETETTLDLAPLRDLKNLQGLILNGKYEKLDVVPELASLRYVAISEEIWDESATQIAAIRKALPNAVVVRSSGMCLGSGWILLLLPVLCFAWRRRVFKVQLLQAA